MPADRLLARRRRSSTTKLFKPVKAGYYGIPPPPTSRPVTFAPNVTPVTYVAPDSDSQSPSPEPGSPSSKLFPPSEFPPSLPSRRRIPPHKRRSMGYIPRPPNAFMLFRADFVRQKHVPGSIETNHGSLSKIIGNCWRALPPDEKKIWEHKAKQAKAEHKAQYPEYRFRPVHNKNKDKKKEKPAATLEDERRCEEVAQLLLEGKKGDELAAAVRRLDYSRGPSPQPQYQPHHGQQYRHRRSSSVPLPNDWYPGIALPALPFNSLRPDSPGPIGGMSRSSRAALGHRRASSAQPMVSRSWTMPLPSGHPQPLHRDDSPLPEVDTSLFEQSFGFSFGGVHQQQDQFGVGMPLYANGPQDHHLSLGPLDTIDAFPQTTIGYGPIDPSAGWVDPMFANPGVVPQSHSSSTYSGSPAPSELSLPVHAPQPTTTGTFHDSMWKDYSLDPMAHMSVQQQHQLHQQHYDVHQQHQQELHHHAIHAQQQQQQQQQHAVDLANSFEHQLDLSQTPACAPLGSEFSALENFLDHHPANFDLGYDFEFNPHEIVQP